MRLTYASRYRLCPCLPIRLPTPASPLLSNLPCPQALAIRETGSYVCELKRVGTGHGVFHFDRWVGGWCGDDRGGAGSRLRGLRSWLSLAPLSTLPNSALAAHGAARPTTCPPSRLHATVLPENTPAPIPFLPAGGWRSATGTSCRPQSSCPSPCRVGRHAQPAKGRAPAQQAAATAPAQHAAVDR